VGLVEGNGDRFLPVVVGQRGGVLFVEGPGVEVVAGLVAKGLLRRTLVVLENGAGALFGQVSEIVRGPVGDPPGVHRPRRLMDKADVVEVTFILIFELIKGLLGDKMLLTFYLRRDLLKLALLLVLILL
jgi:hypothetical protein